MPNSTKNKTPWLRPNVEISALKPGLYLVPTPIGNLGDITLRALDILTAADMVLCEDTRTTGKLLKNYGITAKVKVYNDHSTGRDRASIIKSIASGKALALVSDAGTPLISDPGYKLVQDAQEQGLYITSLPGPNAPLTALLLSGLASETFTFLGFLPSKTSARKKALEPWAGMNTALILFESARRLQKTLSDIQSVFGNTRISVVREISKLYEETKTDTAENLIKFYDKNGAPKGEITMIIEPQAPQPKSLDTMDTEIKTRLKTTQSSKLASEIAKDLNLPKKDVYDYILKLTKT